MFRAKSSPSVVDKLFSRLGGRRWNFGPTFRARLSVGASFALVPLAVGIWDIEQVSKKNLAGREEFIHGRLPFRGGVVRTAKKSFNVY